MNGVESMLTVLIRTGGTYAIGKVINDRYEEITPWKTGKNLKQGYTHNTVKVSWDSGSNQYVLYINGIEADRFTDTYPLCSGNSHGAAAVVTRQERFPETPVSVLYRELLP